MACRDSFISSCFWGETTSLAAGIASLTFIRDNPVIEHIWQTGQAIVEGVSRAAEEVGVPLVFHGKGFVAANRALIASFDWHHAALIHMWLLVLLFGYCSLRELVRHIGPAKVARMFFHSRHA